jgi:hypothetical protein
MAISHFFANFGLEELTLDVCARLPISFFQTWSDSRMMDIDIRTLLICSISQEEFEALVQCLPLYTKLKNFHIWNLCDTASKKPLLKALRQNGSIIGCDMYGTTLEIQTMQLYERRNRKVLSMLARAAVDETLLVLVPRLFAVWRIAANMAPTTLFATVMGCVSARLAENGDGSCVYMVSEN